jgi:hypothetical protein
MKKSLLTKRFRQVLQGSQIPDERAESKHNDRNHNLCSHGSGEKLQTKMITLFKNQKPKPTMSQKHNSWSKGDKQKYNRKQFQASKEIFGNIEKSIAKITENYRNILIATDSICKERKVKNG